MSRAKLTTVYLLNSLYLADDLMAFPSRLIKYLFDEEYWYYVLILGCGRVSILFSKLCLGQVRTPRVKIVLD